MKKILVIQVLVLVMSISNAQSWTLKWASDPQIELSKAQFLSADVGYVLGNWIFPQLPPSNGLIFKTTDGGQTFSNQFGLQPPPHTAAIRDIHFFDQNIGIAVGDSGLILRTINGGDKWNKMVALNMNYQKVVLVDSKRGYAIGVKGTAVNLFETKDGGIRWGTKSLGNNARHYSDIYFQTSKTGYISTVDHNGMGSLFKTSDAGVSWQLISQLQNGFHIFYMSFPTTLIGYASGALGDNHCLAKTVDGGLNWTILNSTLVFPEIWYRKILFLNEDIGYAIRNHDLIMTQDGGQTWTVSQSFPFQLFSFCFPSATTGYLVFRDSFFKTTNGGGMVLQGKKKQLITNPPFKKN